MSEQILGAMIKAPREVIDVSELDAKRKLLHLNGFTAAAEIVQNDIDEQKALNMYSDRILLPKQDFKQVTINAGEEVRKIGNIASVLVGLITVLCLGGQLSFSNPMTYLIATLSAFITSLSSLLFIPPQMGIWNLLAVDLGLGKKLAEIPVEDFTGFIPNRILEEASQLTGLTKVVWTIGSDKQIASVAKRAEIVRVDPILVGYSSHIRDKVVVIGMWDGDDIKDLENLFV